MIINDCVSDKKLQKMKREMLKILFIKYYSIISLNSSTYNSFKWDCFIIENYLENFRLHSVSLFYIILLYIYTILYAFFCS